MVLLPVLTGLTISTQAGGWGRCGWSGLCFREGGSLTFSIRGGGADSVSGSGSELDPCVEFGTLRRLVSDILYLLMQKISLVSSTGHQSVMERWNQGITSEDPDFMTACFTGDQ